MDFFTRCEGLGMKLLRDDKRFIQERLKNTTQKRRILILRRYREIWLSELNGEENASKQNLGRFKANSYLRQITGG